MAEVTVERRVVGGRLLDRLEGDLFDPAGGAEDSRRLWSSRWMRVVSSWGLSGSMVQPTSAGADAFAEGAVGGADDGDAGDEGFGHDVAEGFGVVAGEQHDLDAGQAEQVGEELVVVGAVGVHLR